MNQHRRSSIALVHSIQDFAPAGFTFAMSNFSSNNKFTKLYNKVWFSPSVRVSELQMMTDSSYFNLLDCVENCMILMNNHGGFTVVGWYKRGVISHQRYCRVMVSNNWNVNGNIQQHHHGENNDEAFYLDVTYLMKKLDYSNKLISRNFYRSLRIMTRPLGQPLVLL